MKKLLIVIGLFIAMSLNAQIGFQYFDTVANVQPTTQELLAQLSATQRTGILTGFSQRYSPMKIKKIYDDQGTKHIPKIIVIYFYEFFNDIQNSADSLMSSGTYTQLQLRDAVYDIYQDDFTQSQITAILNQRVQYSKSDGSGDWSYYSSQF